MANDYGRRRALLLTALVTAQLPSTVSENRMIRAWLDTWTGIGHVTVGIDRQGYDLQLTKYANRGWRATFYTSGMEHAPTRSTASAWETTPVAGGAAGGAGCAEAGAPKDEAPA